MEIRLGCMLEMMLLEGGRVSFSWAKYCPQLTIMIDDNARFNGSARDTERTPGQAYTIEDAESTVSEGGPSIYTERGRLMPASYYGTPTPSAMNRSQRREDASDASRRGRERSESTIRGRESVRRSHSVKERSEHSRRNRSIADNDRGRSMIAGPTRATRSQSHGGSRVAERSRGGGAEPLTNANPGGHSRVSSSHGKWGSESHRNRNDDAPTRGRKESEFFAPLTGSRGRRENESFAPVTESQGRQRARSIISRFTGFVRTQAASQDNRIVESTRRRSYDREYDGKSVAFEAPRPLDPREDMRTTVGPSAELCDRNPRPRRCSNNRMDVLYDRFHR